MIPAYRPSAAAFIAALTSSTVVSRDTVTVRSVAEPFGTGTRRAYPSSLPLRSGSTRPMALAAPVEVGTMLIAAARARRRSLCGPSCRFWSWVYAWIVVIRPRWMPNSSWMTFAIGARQFVVHEALEMMWWRCGSYMSSLTPMTSVTSSFFAGAEMITLRAPLVMCTLAFSASVNRPVDSSTTSAPRSPQGSFDGSRSASTLNECPATEISSAEAFTSCGSRPRMLSYLSRCASVALSVRSLTPTSSMSAPRSRAARKKFRPIRPKPLIPTRMVTSAHLLAWCAGARTGEVARPLVGQRQQPADPAGDRVLGQGWVGQRAQLLQRRLAVVQPQLAGAGQVLRGGVAQDLQGTGHPGRRGDRRPSRAAQVRVVEVGQPVGGGAHLSAYSALFPGEHAGVRADAGEQRPDRVAVLDHHPVHAAHLARLGRHADPPGRAHQGHGGLGSGAGDLERAGAARLGQRPVGEERAPPRRDRTAHVGRHHVLREAPHGAAAHVEQAGLAGQRLAVLHHPDDVVAALAEPAGGEHVDLAGVPVDLGDLAPQPAGGGTGVELRLDHHPARDDV